MLQQMMSDPGFKEKSTIGFFSISGALSLGYGLYKMTQALRVRHLIRDLEAQNRVYSVSELRSLGGDDLDEK